MSTINVCSGIQPAFSYIGTTTMLYTLLQLLSALHRCLPTELTLTVLQIMVHFVLDAESAVVGDKMEKCRRAAKPASKSG